MISGFFASTARANAGVVELIGSFDAIVFGLDDGWTR